MAQAKGRREIAFCEDGEEREAKAARGDLGALLIRLRRGRNLIQSELAAKAGLALDTVNKLELGRTQPHPATIRKLAVALGVSVEALTRAGEVVESEASVTAAGVETRLQRGLALWRAVGEYIERDEAGYWLVPSASEEGLLYRVSPNDLACSCEDHRFSGHVICKHGWVVRLHLAYEMAASRRTVRERVA